MLAPLHGPQATKNPLLTSGGAVGEDVIAGGCLIPYRLLYNRVPARWPGSVPPFLLLDPRADFRVCQCPLFAQAQVSLGIVLCGR